MRTNRYYIKIDFYYLFFTISFLTKNQYNSSANFYVSSASISQHLVHWKSINLWSSNCIMNGHKREKGVAPKLVSQLSSVTMGKNLKQQKMKTTLHFNIVNETSYQIWDIFFYTLVPQVIWNVTIDRLQM